MAAGLIPRSAFLKGLLAATAAAFLAGCTTGAHATDDDTTSTPTTEETVTNPLDGMAFYVDPAALAAVQVAAWQAAGDTADAEQLSTVAEQPVATWFSGQQSDTYAAAAELTTAAEAAGQVAVIVAYNRPARDAGSYSAGGATDVDTYLTWVGDLAAGIGDRTAVVVLEPDAIAQEITGVSTAFSADERYAMLAAAVGILKAQPATTVFVDAGNSAWVTDTGALATALRASGVAAADGFALNVSNFQTTADSLAYGEEVSALLDGALFVVDTSRNGAGAVSTSVDVHAWCNPGSARVGQLPTTTTDSTHAAGYLWVKEPGTSDGSCRAGEPAAGEWWPEYALLLTS